MDASFLMERFSELLLRTREHLFLTGISTAMAVLCGVPLGIFITRQAWLRSLVFGLAGIIQTIPSLAMLAFLLAAIGKIGTIPAIIALTLYAFLPIIQNTATGIDGVAPEIMEASRGMGMTPSQQLRMVSVPLAAPVMIAGIRTAAVISVGIATLSAFIGAGGLGEFINRGLSLSDTNLILLGAIPSALLALYVSFSISAVEWGITKRKRRGLGILSGSAGMYLSFVPLALLFVIGIGGGVAKVTRGGPGATITIGSKNFTEQLVLAEIMAQRIEGATSITVERKLNLGGTMICHEAILAGEIDLYPEYTGTALLTILKEDNRAESPDKVFILVAEAYHRRFDLRWLPPFGFNNTYALAVRSADAKNRHWKTIGDLAQHASGLRAGFTAEFSERPDGYPGLRDRYGFVFGSVIDLDPSLMYDAVRNEEVDVITAFSTDSRIRGYNLTLLQDNLSYFPPYRAAPVVRADVLERHPEIARALAPLAGIINEEAMQELNFRVDQENTRPSIVAEEFLREHGLLK